MGCNSDYMSASHYEREISQVMCLLEQIEGKSYTSQSWSGYHPKVYGRVTREMGDKLVAKLCKKLQSTDVNKCGLEMQIWWLRHQAADKARIQSELDAQRTQKEREAALSKLTTYERKLLNV